MLSSYRCISWEKYITQSEHSMQITEFLSMEKKSWKQHTYTVVLLIAFDFTEFSQMNGKSKLLQFPQCVFKVLPMYVYSWIFEKQRSLFLMLGFQKHIKLPTTQHIVVCTLFCKRYFFESQKPPHIWNVLTWYRHRIDTSKKDQRPAFLHYAITKTEANAAFDKHQGNLIFSDYLRYWSSQFVWNGHFRSKWVWFTHFTAKHSTKQMNNTLGK